MVATTEKKVAAEKKPVKGKEDSKKLPAVPESVLKHRKRREHLRARRLQVYSFKNLIVRFRNEKQQCVQAILLLQFVFDNTMVYRKYFFLNCSTVQSVLSKMQPSAELFILCFFFLLVLTILKLKLRVQLFYWNSNLYYFEIDNSFGDIKEILFVVTSSLFIFLPFVIVNLFYKIASF